MKGKVKGKSADIMFSEWQDPDDFSVFPQSMMTMEVDLSKDLPSTVVAKLSPEQVKVYIEYRKKAFEKELAKNVVQSSVLQSTLGHIQEIEAKIQLEHAQQLEKLKAANKVTIAKAFKEPAQAPPKAKSNDMVDAEMMAWYSAFGAVAKEDEPVMAIIERPKRCEIKRQRTSFNPFDNEGLSWKPYRRGDETEIRSLEELLEYCDSRLGGQNLTVRRKHMVGHIVYEVVDGDVLFRFVPDENALAVKPDPAVATATPATAPAEPFEREFV